MNEIEVMLNKSGIYRRFIKRPIDFILSLMAIITLSPLFVIVGTLIMVKIGIPVLFKQHRPGLNEKIFTMYKFRTMTDEKDEDGELLPDSVRLTKFGRFLRSTSLDELPELFNILKGEMSIVGPRPQLVKDMVFMTPDQRKRHSIVPGLTGWAQINGRNGITWEQKLDFDIEYLEKISFLLDCKIVLITIAKVVNRDDINTEGMNTSEDLRDYLLRIGKIDNNTYINKSRNLFKE